MTHAMMRNMISYSTLMNMHAIDINGQSFYKKQKGEVHLRTQNVEDDSCNDEKYYFLFNIDEHSCVTQVSVKF
jgi:hypothetical protein